MRQPDNLPAFCRVHRNGRPLIMQIRTLPDGLGGRSAGSTARPPGLGGVPGALPPRACARRRAAPGPGRSWRLTTSAAPSARGSRARCAGAAGARSRGTPGTWPCRPGRPHRGDGRRIGPLPRPRAARGDAAAAQIRALRSRLPAAGRVRSGRAAAAVTRLPAWRTSGQRPPAGGVPGPGAGARAGAAGGRLGAVRAGCRGPDRRAGPDATHVACSGVAGPGPCPGRRVAAAAGPAASRAAGRPAPSRAAPGAGRGPGRGRVPRPARRTGTGSRRAGRAAGLLAAARGARRVGVHGCCPAGRGTGPGPPRRAGITAGRPAAGAGRPGCRAWPGPRGGGQRMG